MARPDDTRVVFDTNVFVDHIHLKRRAASYALQTASAERHVMVTCEKLLRELRGVLCRGNDAMYSYIDRMIMQMYPIDCVEKHPNPQIRISFGPQEDQFHMQLAIDARAAFHVTSDRGVLECEICMREHGVNVLRPASYASKFERRAAGARSPV